MSSQNCLFRTSAHCLIELYIHLFFLTLTHRNCLCSLEIKLFLVASFANIFFYSIDCLFILFMVFFSIQKLVSLIKFSLFIFAFIFIFLGDRSKKIVFSLTFMSLIHFEFIFVYGVREYPYDIILYVTVQFSQHHLLKRLSFLHYIVLPPLSEIS